MLVATAMAGAQVTDTFWLGADISGTTELEARGVQLMNAQGEPRENTALMKELGLNAVRLRVWVNPQRGFSSKEDVLVMAQRAKALISIAHPDDREELEKAACQRFGYSFLRLK